VKFRTLHCRDNEALRPNSAQLKIRFNVAFVMFKLSRFTQLPCQVYRVVAYGEIYQLC